MKVLFAAAECAPFFKTGGLGDVAGSLPKALKEKGVDIALVLPYFTKMPDVYKAQCEDIAYFYVDVGWRHQYCGIKKLILDNITYYFIDNQYYFDRENLYGYYDDGERFAFFSMAIIEMMEQVDFIPDYIHSNDFHTAMIPFLLKEKYHWIAAYRAIQTVVTIHNIEFQGMYDKGVLADFFGMGLEHFDDGSVRYNDGVNFLKAGIMYANRVTTVSPSYAQEIQTPEYGYGLDGVLRMESGKLSGILNGIDYELNNPETDQKIVANYSVTHLSGKGANKRALQERLGLPVRGDVPVIGIVSRLTHQKGFHLVIEELRNILQQDVQLVLLGTGDPAFEHAFGTIANEFPEKMSANILFDIQLAQLIYAGSDLFLMPSKFEPCGLSQMISMRYGTLPIVHEIGGLKDTVIPYNPILKTGTGFGFAEFRSFYLMHAIQTALDVYHHDKKTWKHLIETAMVKDFSWTTSSEAYLQLYQK